MRKKLTEAVDLELAVIKALNNAPLVVAEVDALKQLSTRDLMVDHGLDYLLADKVALHAKSEVLRTNAQDLEAPIEDYQFSSTSLTRSFPIDEPLVSLNESRRLSNKSLKRLVLAMINEEQRR